MTGALFYAVYFAAIGIFGPYWTLYLKHLGLSSLQISVIYSLPPLIRIFFPVCYGYLADRWQVRKHVLAAASLAQIVPLFFLLRFHSYSALLIVFVLYSIFNSVILPFAEATFQEQHEQKKLDYGRTRLWGTLSFIVVAVAYGKLLDRASDAWILYGFLAFLSLQAAISFRVPAANLKPVWSHGVLKKIASNRAVWLFLFCALLHNLSQGTFMGFYSIYLSKLGISDSRIGLQWAIAAISEISILWFAFRILNSFRYRTLFTLSLLAAAARWILMAVITSYWGLTAVQLLHAFTFGVFHITSMRLIHHFFPEGFRSIGQSLYASIGNGVGTVLGLWLNGLFWDRLGAGMFFVSAGVSVAAAILSLALNVDPEKAPV